VGLGPDGGGIRTSPTTKTGIFAITLRWRSLIFFFRGGSMEKTLSIVKPDGVQNHLIGEVIKRFEENGLNVVGLKMIFMDKKEAEGFYAVHRGKAFFESLTTFMSSGPVVVIVLEGEGAIAKTRHLMGATDPKQANGGTLRRQYATDIERNIVHGSDAPETATFEINYFFNALEIFPY
jgi:nucleoside-diphosphate kinase